MGCLARCTVNMQPFKDHFLLQLIWHSRCRWWNCGACLCQSSHPETPCTFRLCFGKGESFRYGDGAFLVCLDTGSFCIFWSVLQNANGSILFGVLLKAQLGHGLLWGWFTWQVTWGDRKEWGMEERDREGGLAIRGCTQGCCWELDSAGTPEKCGVSQDWAQVSISSSLSSLRIFCTMLRNSPER